MKFGPFECAKLGPSDNRILKKLAVHFGFNRGVRPFYAARRFDELSRKQFHNATTRFFTPKSMTMVSAGAIRGE